MLVAALVCSGCGSRDRQEQPARSQDVAVEAPALTAEQDALVQKAVTVANAVERAPETLAKVLADAGLTEDEYKSLVYRISADPVLAAAYEKAREH